MQMVNPFKPQVYWCTESKSWELSGFLYYHVNIDIDLVFDLVTHQIQSNYKDLDLSCKVSTLFDYLSYNVSDVWRLSDIYGPKIVIWWLQCGLQFIVVLFFFIKLRRLCLVRCTLQVPFCLELADVNFYNYYLVSVFVSGFYTFLIFFFRCCFVFVGR